MTKPAFQPRRFLLEASPDRATEYMPRQQILYKQGERGDAVFYLLEGLIALTMVSHGKERIIALLGPGSFVGKECIASSHPLNGASAKTLTNCMVLRVGRKEMLRLIKSEEKFAASFLDYLLGRIGRYHEDIMSRLCERADERLARTLLLLANFGANGKTEAVVPFISQDEFAEAIGTTRSRTCFFMNGFRKLGFIAYETNGPLSIRSEKLSKWLTGRSAVGRSRPRKMVKMEQTAADRARYVPIMDATPNDALAVRCPVCGAKPEQLCELSTGSPRINPHKERIWLALDKLQREAMKTSG